MSEYKLIIAGGSAVGKSSLVIQFIQGYFVDDYDPTIEDSYRKQIFVDDEMSLLDILDTAGPEEYSAMRDRYIRNGQSFLMTYAINSRQSFEDLKSNYLPQILRIKDDDKVPMVLVGNKCDLEDERQVPIDEAIKWAEEISMPFYETSAKARINVADIFIEATREIVKRNGHYVTNRGKKKKDCCVS